MANIEALTLLESEGSECQNIGTILVGDNKRELVEQKIKDAIEAHFDSSVKLPKIDWEAIEGYTDTEVHVKMSDDENPSYTQAVTIQRTVIY